MNDQSRKMRVLMSKIRSQRVPYLEHPSVEMSSPINWEDLRVFLTVARHTSFRSAAQELGLAFNTVRRHVDRLEHVTKTVLLARRPQGIALTREGKELISRANRLEEAAKDLTRGGKHPSLNINGKVRISVTEGLGTFWLMPQLVSFQRAHPNLLLEVNCTFREPDLAKMEADISVQLSKPKQVDLKTVRLGSMHVMPFASPEYLNTFGTPRTLQDVENHKIVEQLSPQLDLSAVDRLFPDKERLGFVSVATNTSTAHFWAVIRGAGLGMLPTYLACLGAKIAPVDIKLYVKHDIWLSYHPDSKRLKRVALVIEKIRKSFSAKQYPWFGEEFIHPYEFEVGHHALSEDLSFAGLVSRDRSS